MEFKISSELKNIIGKDLIVNDEVAIFELVKNSYDAYATRVDIIFDNDKIIIRDNGKGMNIDDIKNKWLFVAYSAKKDNLEDQDIFTQKQYQDYRNKIQTKRGYAGAKGIGRFSSDRLGKKLTLYARKVGSNTVHKIEVNWVDFEKNSQEEFINIPVTYQKLSASKVSFDNFTQGVILEITNLRSQWDDLKIESLKRSLGKLINPFEVNTQSNHFQIYIKKQNSLLEEPVKNELIDVLTLKTTKIELVIDKNKITTKLTDRGTLVYEIEEDNPFNYIDNITIILLYLNQKARNNFTRIMGVTTKEFANVMLYNNGFRVYPYGEPGDDSFGIDKRYQQGIRRYLSTRNLIGSININNYSEEFKEKSSRDSGLIETESFKALKKIFWDKALKRLEKYVVGIQWSLDDNIRDKDNNSDVPNNLSSIDTKYKIIDLISNLTNKEKVIIKNFDVDFLNILDKSNNKITNKLILLAEKSSNKDLKREILLAHKEISNLEKEKNILEKELKDNYDKLVQQEKQLEVEKKEKKEVLIKLEKEQKKSLFQQSIIGTEKEQIIGLQHQIFHSSSRINRNLKLLIKTLDMEKLTEKQKKYIGVISSETNKINSISRFITKANFNLTASDIEEDILIFMRDYINELYLSKDKIIDSNIKIINFEVKDVYVMKFKPLEITTLIDNFIQNSDKANANEISFSYKIVNDKLEIFIKDNGRGIESSYIDNIFDLGYTTTTGSGIGLFIVKNIIDKLGGEIKVVSQINVGTEFIIRFSK